MTYAQAKALKSNTSVYVKGSNEKFRVDSIEIDEANKAVWVIGFENGGLKKRHHRTLSLTLK
jgi:hypothetical protein